MVQFMDIVGAVVGTSAYVDNVQVGRDVALRLPTLTPATVDVKAMGTFTIAVWQLLENMEAAITKIGHDKGLKAALSPVPKNYEFRWVQTVTDANGNTRNVGCKAFIRASANVANGADIVVGEAPETEIPLTATSYRLVIDGEDYHNVNRLANKLVIAGVDMSGHLSML